jgi:mono/diheme cytochrome c family protein
MLKESYRAMWLSPILSLVCLLCALTALAQETHVGKLTGHADAGKKNYQRWCIGCHGPFGDGNG